MKLLTQQCNELNGKSILVLGDGNFSFGNSLSQKIAYINQKVNLIVSCLEKKEDLLLKYPLCDESINAIKNNGHHVLYQVDATHLQKTFLCHSDRFDYIIFNFPHVGGKSNLKKNRQLLNDFFASAHQLLRSMGESCIMVSLCAGQGGTEAEGERLLPQKADSWQLVEMAALNNLILVDICPFEIPSEYLCVGFRSQNKPFMLSGALTHTLTSVDPIELIEHCATVNCTSPPTVSLQFCSYERLIHLVNKPCIRPIIHAIINNKDNDSFSELVISAQSTVLLKSCTESTDSIPHFYRLPSKWQDLHSEEEIILQSQRNMLGWPGCVKQSNNMFYYFSKPLDALVSLMSTIDVHLQWKQPTLWKLTGLMDVSSPQLRPYLIRIRVHDPEIISSSLLHTFRLCWPWLEVEEESISLECLVDGLTHHKVVRMYSPGQEVCICGETFLVQNESYFIEVDWVDLLQCSYAFWNVNAPDNQSGKRVLLCDNVVIQPIDGMRSFVQASSLYPTQHQQDVSFWLNQEQVIKMECFGLQDVVTSRVKTIGYSIALDCLMDVQLIDIHQSSEDFVKKFPLRCVSFCYRFTFQHLDKALDRLTVNRIQNFIRLALMKILSVELR